MANLTRVQRAPEAYALTEFRDIRANAAWTPSGTRSGRCFTVETVECKVPASRYNEATGEWEKYTATESVEIRTPFGKERTYNRRIRHTEARKVEAAQITLDHDYNNG